MNSVFLCFKENLLNEIPLENVKIQIYLPILDAIN